MSSSVVADLFDSKLSTFDIFPAFFSVFLVADCPKELHNDSIAWFIAPV